MLNSLGATNGDRVSISVKNKNFCYTLTKKPNKKDKEIIEEKFNDEADSLFAQTYVCRYIGKLLERAGKFVAAQKTGGFGV
jgi:hypothetical protein